MRAEAIARALAEAVRVHAPTGVIASSGPGAYLNLRAPRGTWRSDLNEFFAGVRSPDDVASLATFLLDELQAEVGWLGHAAFPGFPPESRAISSVEPLATVDGPILTLGWSRSDGWVFILARVAVSDLELG